MSIFIYIYHGMLILLALISPKHRKATFLRWGRTRPYKVILEIGSGIIGLAFLGVLIWMLFSNFTQQSPVQHSQSKEM